MSRAAMRAEERRAYVLGVLDACRDHKATEDATAQVCVDLGIAPEELLELRKEALARLAKPPDGQPVAAEPLSGTP